MQHATHLPEVPRLENFNYFTWFSSLRQDNHDLLTLAKIEGVIPPLPDQYTPPTYAIEFVVRGNTIGKVDDTVVGLHPNDAFFILADSIHKDVATSEDTEMYVMGISSQFVETLNIHFTQAQLSQLFMRPIWHMSDRQMAVVIRYIELLRTLIDDGKSSAVVHLTRSFIHNLSEDYDAFQPQQLQAMTRAEQICGRFLSLVEVKCREQHSVEWYAKQLSLAPKYLSNVVKQTLDLSPNACIDRAIIRQAKSLLSSTSLSIQQISDRLGFLNQSHFGTFFRRQTGVSPSAFRSSNR